MTDHQVKDIVWSGPERGTRRITCICGWTEKSGNVTQWTLTLEQFIEVYDPYLMLQWEKHVYTPEERSILMELKGHAIPKQYCKQYWKKP